MPRIFLPPMAAHRTDPLLLVIRCFSQRCWERQQLHAACVTLCLAFIHSFVLCTVYHSIMGNANHWQLQDAKSKAPPFKPRCTCRICLSQPQRQLALSKRKLLLLWSVVGMFWAVSHSLLNLTPMLTLLRWNIGRSKHYQYDCCWRWGRPWWSHLRQLLCCIQWDGLVGWGWWRWRYSGDFTWGQRAYRQSSEKVRVYCTT